jgi:hypothetical protein
VVTYLLIRFVLGGLIVSAFAVVSEMFKPKTFAGLFGAAPSSCELRDAWGMPAAMLGLVARTRTTATAGCTIRHTRPRGPRTAWLDRSSRFVALSRGHFVEAGLKLQSSVGSAAGAPGL